MGVELGDTSQVLSQSWSVLDILAGLQSSQWLITLSRYLYLGNPTSAPRKPVSSSSPISSVVAARKAAAAAAESKAIEEFAIKRPVDPSTPAAAPWKFSNVSIHTIEHVEPPVAVTSRETMERLGWRLRLLGATPDTLEQMTGIKERRMWEKGTTGVQAATWAARKAIEASGIDPNRIGIICNTSVWRDYLEPGMAVCIHHELGLPASCINMDITNACVGMVNGMLTVATMIETGVVDYALVVDAEAPQDFYEATMQRLCRTFNLQEFRNQLAGLTIGCGAVATILCRSDLAPPGRNHRLTGAVARCAPYAWPMCTGRYERANTDPTMVLHGLQVFRQAWEVAQQELGLTADNIDVAVPHQVGKKVHRLGATYCGFDVNKAIATYPYTGNVGPASIGIALSIAEKEGRVKEGMRVCLSAFGSGLNCIFAEVMW